MSEETVRASFSGKVGFIIATSASAVGLGNLWRFPYVTSHYGGGIFVLVYVLVAFTFGVSLMMMETSIGRKTGKSSIAAFGELCRKYKAIGYLASVIPIIILAYYCVIGGWVTKWLFESSIGNLSTIAGDGGNYWWEFITGATDGGFTGPSFWMVIFLLMCILCIIAGVEKGIEKLSKYVMPALLIMIIGIICYEMTMPGIWDGVTYYLRPDVDEFGSDTVLGAIGQAFYSISISMGILITYGSYSKKDVDLEKASVGVVSVDILVAVLAGFLIVPVAFMFGFQDSQGMGLMFNALPQVFVSMTGGAIIAPVFYLLVLLAALTSAISLAETCTSLFMDGAKMSRGRSVAISSILLLIVAMICILGFEGGPLFVDTPLSQGVGWLGFLDTLTNNLMMPAIAIITCIFIAYVVKIKVLEDEISISSGFKTRPVFRLMIKYVCPLLLTVLLAVNIGKMIL